MKKQYLVVAMAVTAALMAGGCKGKPAVEPALASTEETTEEETTEEETTEEETTEEESEEETETEKPAASQMSADLSDDIYSFQVQLNDEVYQFPMTYEDLLGRGWKYDGDETEKLTSMSYSGTQVFRKGSAKLYFDIVNLSSDTKPMSECLIGGIGIDSYQAKDGDLKVVLPKGITMDVSTADDIKAAYGEPSDSYETSLEYSMDSYQRVRIGIDKTSGKLYSINFKNYIELEDQKSEEKQVSSEVPEIVKKYKAPEAISDEFADFVVEYAGDIYKLPAPVSEFEANGWKILKDSSDATVGGGNTGWVTLMKDNQTLRTMVKNYADPETPVSNCFVISLMSDDYKTKVPMTIAKKIKPGMSQADLESALSGTEVDKKDQGSEVRYRISPAQSTLDCYDIFVKEGSVRSIEIENSPKIKDYVK